MANYTYNVSSYSSYGSLYYSFSGDASGLNPNITANVSVGDTLTFNVSAIGHPFYIKTALSSGRNNAYNTGTSSNGTQLGTTVVTISESTPTTLYYQCSQHYGMNGQITLNISTTPTTTTTTTTTTPDPNAPDYTVYISSTNSDFLTAGWSITGSDRNGTIGTPSSNTLYGSPQLTFNDGDVIDFVIDSPNHGFVLTRFLGTNIVTSSFYSADFPLGYYEDGLHSGTHRYVAKYWVEQSYNKWPPFAPNPHPFTQYNNGLGLAYNYMTYYADLLTGNDGNVATGEFIINPPPTTTTTTTTTTAAPTSTTTTVAPTTTTTTSTTNTTPVPTTTTTTTTTTTPKPEVSVTASLGVVGDNLEITFNPINFPSQWNTTISWFLSNGSVLSSADGPYTPIFDLSGFVIIGYKYTIPLSRFAVEFAEYTFTITSSDGTYSSSTILRWTSPGTPTTTTTTTTTDSPLDVVIETNNPIECPCGEIKFPKGGHYYPRDNNMPDTSTDFVDIDPVFGTRNTLYGLRVLVKEGSNSKDYGLIHSDVIYLKSEDKFVTVTDTIEDQITPDKLALYIDLDGFYRMNLENVITVTVQDEINKKTLGHKSFGTFGSRQKIARSSLIDKPSLVLNLTGTTNLYKNSLIITVQSNCHYDRKPCCDSLPQIMRVTNSGDALYARVGSGVCIPLDNFYTGEEINYQTTTTASPDSVTFVKDLNVTTGASEATLSAQIKSYYNSDIKYWWELTNTDCLTKLTTLQTAKSNEEISFTDTRAGDASYRIRVMSPEIKFSNTVSVTIPTTTTSTTTPAPTTTTTTTTTTADPSTQVSFDIIANSKSPVSYPLHWDTNFDLLIQENGLAHSLGHDNMTELLNKYNDSWLEDKNSTPFGQAVPDVYYSARYDHIGLEYVRRVTDRSVATLGDMVTVVQYARLNYHYELNVDVNVINPVGTTAYQWQYVDLDAEGGVFIPGVSELDSLNWKSASFVKFADTGAQNQQDGIAALTTLDSRRQAVVLSANRETLEVQHVYDMIYQDVTSHVYWNGLDTYQEGLVDDGSENLFDRRFLIRCIATNNGVSTTSQTMMMINYEERFEPYNG